MRCRTPFELRQLVVDSAPAFRHELPARASHVFIHPTDVCDIACTHCMYSSNTTTTTRRRPRLVGNAAELLLRFLNGADATKLSISGGGEPFLELESVLRILAGTTCTNIELVTAGRWGRSRKTTDGIIREISNAVVANGVRPVLMLRLSADRFHRSAPNPVRLSDHVNIVESW